MATETLGSIPPLAPLYTRAAVSAALPGAGTDLPDKRLEVLDVEVDRRHVAAYARVCGYRLTDVLPPTYLHVLAFPLSVALMAERRFPFPLPGLVHVANRAETLRPVTAGERISLTVETADLRPHRRGRQFDVLAEARVGDEVVWSSTSTYLRRGPGGDDTVADPDLPLEPPAEGADAAVWRVRGDTGRRYAAVSGDRNPIHLSPVTSRLFGFRRPIAHGMWTAARAVAAIEDRLPDRHLLSVRFGKPLPLPSTVAYAAAERPDGWAFAVRERRSGAPYVTGAVTPL